MDDLHTRNPKSPPLSLPPGFRFHPTDHQILSFYLPNKNNNETPSPSPPTYLLDVISDLNNLYDYEPYDLPESDSLPYGYGGNKRHWYYFTVSSRKGAKRISKGGYWKRKCRSRNVLGDGGLLGTKTSFVFYKRDSSSKRCSMTNWMMIEYALVDHQMDFFVLCRVFLKTCSGNKVLKTGLNSHAEEILAEKNNSFTDVPCRQPDRASVSGIGEVVAREEAFDNVQHQLTTELNNHVTVRPFSDSGFVSSLGVPQSDQLANFSHEFIQGGVSFDDVNTIFLEGDYLELDDLVCPLLDFGSSG